jgi:outer membrane protein assembly factor BamE (lipoprotein component of BamABCDE complex)
MKKMMLILISVFMTACVYTQNTYQNESNNIDKQKMVQIETGKTDKQWIINNLGMPDKIQSNRDGTEIYEYVNERKVNSDKRFIFLFSINSEKVIAKRILSVTFKNGIVDSVNTRDE